MSEKMLTCGDCKAEFPFTDGEQQFFKQKGFAEPKRCKPCRDGRKRDREKKESAREDSSGA